MKKDKLNTILRSYVKENLSPKSEDISFISEIYQSIKNVLGDANCIQVGSYSRFTSVIPLHDLDILYIIGDWDKVDIDPLEQLNTLNDKLIKLYASPRGLKFETKVQSHSISIKYFDKHTEVFAVDIVPSLIFEKNEFGKNMFYVPEIIKLKRGKLRENYYLDLKNQNHKIHWIPTDPLGYIEEAKRINEKNSDFRKSVKFLKSWKDRCKIDNVDFKIKSFHIEQLLVNAFKNDSSLEIFDAVFYFLTDLKLHLIKPAIVDRANRSRFIDEYISELSPSQLDIISKAVDSILIQLENVEPGKNIEQTLNSGINGRTVGSESFLFDQRIPVLSDSSLEFEIDAKIIKHEGSLLWGNMLSKVGYVVEIGNKLRFTIIKNNTGGDLIKWKVKNDKICNHERGEITDNKTKNDPESVAYKGKHFVEAYSIKDNVCIAKHSIKVIVPK